MPICRTCRGQYDDPEEPRCPRCGCNVGVWKRLTVNLPEFIVYGGGILASLPAVAAMIAWLLFIPPDESGLYFPVLTFVCLGMCGLSFYLVYKSRFFWWEDWWAQQVYRNSRISIDLLIAVTFMVGLFASMLWVLYFTNVGRPNGLTAKVLFALIYMAGFVCLTAAVTLIVVGQEVEKLKNDAPAPIFVNTKHLLRVVVDEAINSINLLELGANTTIKCAGTNTVYEVYQALRVPQQGGVHVLLRECKCVEHPTADGKPQGKLMEMLWRVEADCWGRVQLLRPGSLEPYDGNKRMFRETARYSY